MKQKAINECDRKRRYVTPQMTVVEFQTKCQLLQASANLGAERTLYGDPFGGVILWD
jgi:hypothetical protein